MAKVCWECKGKMKEYVAKTPEGVEYRYWRCSKCSEEVLDIKQLHAVAEKYRALKAYSVTISKWGSALAIRIPREITQVQRIKEGKKALLIPEKTGFKVIPEKA